MIFFTLGLTFNIFSQVGINTIDPTAVLDIDGNLRIRDVPTWPNPSIGSSETTTVLVADDDGYVYSDPNIIKTTFIRGNNTGNFTLLSLSSQLTSWNKIGWNNISIDDNKEFNNNEFVAKKTGIYAVYVQYQTAAAVSAGLTGVGVLKRKGGSTNLSVIAEESFLNVSIGLGLNLSVTPSTRKVFTIVDMDKGDALLFGAIGLNTTVQLLGGANSYFTIFQIK